MTTSWLLRDVEVGGNRSDVVVDAGRIEAIGPSLPAPATSEVLDGRGGALIPGLWDQHIHLVALAATRRSVVVGPPEVTDPHELASALQAANSDRATGWIRAVGYHESVAGDLDRERLDRLRADVPVRVQHRSGALWVVNSLGLRELGLDHATHAGLERDEGGRLTGRLFGADRWLRGRLAIGDPPDLGAVARDLARYGVTGVTDATPYEQVEDLSLLADAAAASVLPQRVVAMGGPALATATFPAPLARGPVKLLLADHSLPSFDELIGWIGAAHAAGRPVAAHSVTRASLTLMLAALDTAGSAPGDRIEHGSVIPPELYPLLAEHALTVVTQPNFVYERGDAYLAEVDPDDRPHLYPCHGLLHAGIAVGGSTDAPFGHPDPWRAIAAAIERRTVGGHIVGPNERLPAARALELFLGTPTRPGTSRTLAPGSPADLCLLHVPISELGAGTTAEVVRATFIEGRLIHPQAP